MRVFAVLAVWSCSARFAEFRYSVDYLVGVTLLAGRGRRASVLVTPIAGELRAVCRESFVSGGSGS